jgi:hypothetical protein
MHGYNMETENEIIVPEHRKLNMGSGFKKKDDHWNVDINPKGTPDQIWNFEDTPWPWEDNFFEKIFADNVIEHLGQRPADFAKIIQEMYRVSANQAEWAIIVPHYRCDLFWDDFTHVRPITEKTMKMFDQQNNYDAYHKKLSDSAFGFSLGVDLEVIDATYDIVGYWQKLQNDGLLGQAQLNINLNTMANVCESINIFIRVHKPGRHETWLANNFK